jgi:hypothetical protein
MCNLGLRLIPPGGSNSDSQPHRPKLLVPYSQTHGSIQKEHQQTQHSWDEKSAVGPHDVLYANAIRLIGLTLIRMRNT